MHDIRPPKPKGTNLFSEQKSEIPLAEFKNVIARLFTLFLGEILRAFERERERHGDKS